MPDTPARCEPPEALRGVDGWHVLKSDSITLLHPETYALWLPRLDMDKGRWPLWIIDGRAINAEDLTGYRYLSPVPAPPEIAALVRESRDALVFMQSVMEQRGDHGVSILIRALSTALAAPSFKEIPDAD